MMFRPVFDPTYLLVLAGAVLSMLASAKVKSTYARYARVGSRTGMTGADAARRILDSQGIYDVSVQQVAGELTDHYDPSAKVLRLSSSTYGSTSVAALGVAAHECGQAVQHAHSYAPLKFRTALVPAANLGATIAWPLLIFGLLISGRNSFLIQIGILLFSLSVLFQLVTLPVEINASARALKLLEQTGILYRDETGAVKNVLSAAALTYVAAAAASLLQLLRVMILFGGRRDSD